MLSKSQCALLKSVKTVQQPTQKPKVVATPKPISMGEAFKQFTLNEYQRNKFN